MNRISILLLFLISLKSFSQSAPLVSMNGIGEIKVGMKKAEVEKITGQKIKFINLLRKDDNWNRDTIKLTHKDVAYDLVFDKDFINEKSNDYIVYEMSSSSVQLKTKSGIGIGDDKLKIISTYNDFMIHIIPEWEGPDYKIKSKTKSTVWLFGDNSDTVIIFNLINGKVTSFCVMYNEGC